MAPMKFARLITSGKTIDVYNNGDMLRDFTYIDDIVEGTVRVIDTLPEVNSDGLRYGVYNIGCGHTVRLMDFISELEKALGVKADINFMPMQPGDVYETYADTSKLERDFGYKPRVDLHTGIGRFAEWFKSDKNPLK